MAGKVIRSTGRSAEMMDRLGVSIYDGAGNLRDMDDVLPEVLTAMSGMENETERNAIAMTLFGRNAEAILPILALGADNMAAYMEEAHELGLVMGEEDLKAANNFRMEVDQLKQQLSKVAMTLGIELIPLFKDLVDWMQWAAPRAIDFGKTVVGVGEMILWPFLRFFEGVKKGFGLLIDYANDAIDIYNKVSDEVSKLGIEMGHISNIDMSSPIEDLGRATSTTLDEVQDDYEEAQAAMSEALIPGWAGQTEYIRGRIKAEGIELTKEEREAGITQLDKLMELQPTAAAPTVYAGKASPTAAGGTTTGGQSSVSLLVSINDGIDESNRLSQGIISAVNSIQLAAPSGMGGGFGGDAGLTADSEEVQTLSRSEAYRNLAQIVPGRL